MIPQIYLFHFSCISANMAGSNSSVRGGRQGKEEPPISRAELRQFENSLLHAMERMFNEHLPTTGTRAPQQHSLTKSRRGLFGHSGQHDGGARGRSFHPRVLIGVEDYCVSTKRKIQQETRGRSYGQQNPCEKECHQPKLSVIVQNEKMRDSTICEEESHKIMCERDTQKLSEKEDESCEELFTTNMIIPSSSLVPYVT